HIARLRRCMSAGVAELLFDDDKDESRSGDDGDDADGPPQDGEEDTKVSPAQMARLYSQAVAVLDALEEERVRDLLIVEHTRTALIALEQHLDSSRSAAQSTTADDLAKEAMEDASLVRLENSLLLIAEKVSEKSVRKFYPETILSWVRQFRQLGGFFKRDGIGVREREWILSEDDLSMDLLGWLKAQKGVSTKITHAYINEKRFAREGGNLKLAKYGLSLPISTTTVNVWMRKLGCVHDMVRQTYYTDGHERPDVKVDRSDYIRKQRRLALRKNCWTWVEWSSLTEKEQQAFSDLRETGPEADSAERINSRWTAWSTSSFTSIV
ncbi:MAG: hypothetical protein ABJ201_21930, partial [Nisaea sp.]